MSLPSESSLIVRQYAYGRSWLNIGFFSAFFFGIGLFGAWAATDSQESPTFRYTMIGAFVFGVTMGLYLCARGVQKWINPQSIVTTDSARRCSRMASGPLFARATIWVRP